MTDAPTPEALVAKWREDAARLDRSIDLGHAILASNRRAHADELEAALAASKAEAAATAGEVVAEFRRLWANTDDTVRDLIRSEIAALSAPAVAVEPGVVMARCVSECLENGDGFWKPCSGCYETSDGYNVHGFPYSPTFRCNLGGGCHECGGLGAVWFEISDVAMRGWEADYEPAAGAVPDGFVIPDSIAGDLMQYERGWNECRNAMLAAATQDQDSRNG